MDNFDKSIMYKGMINLQRDRFGNPLHEGDIVVEISRMLLITKRDDNGMIILRDHEGDLLKIDKKSLVIEKDRNNKDIHIGDIVKIAPKTFLDRSTVRHPFVNSDRDPTVGAQINVFCQNKIVPLIRSSFADVFR